MLVASLYTPCITPHIPLNVVIYAATFVSPYPVTNPKTPTITDIPCVT